MLYEPCDVPIRISHMQRIDSPANTLRRSSASNRFFSKKWPSGRSARRARRMRKPFRAERNLVLYVRPIASRFVATAAAKAADTAELYRLLALASAMPRSAPHS